MSEKTGIAWTEATWNPWHGCHKISPGCKNCYMFSEKARYGQNPNVVVRSKTTFNAPLKWKDPRLVFTCSWSDWLIEEADPWRQEAYGIIRRTPHTYQILTKRPERAAEHWPCDDPPPNAWLGVSVEDKKYGLPRIDILRTIPAALRFLSIEPQLEDLGNINLEGIHWVIIGAESGAGARPFDVAWVRDLIEQCKSAGVLCFVKQFGNNPVEQELTAWPKGCTGEAGGWEPVLHDKKGGNPEEWPEWARVRQMPEVKL